MFCIKFRPVFALMTGKTMPVLFADEYKINRHFSKCP